MEIRCRKPFTRRSSKCHKRSLRDNIRERGAAIRSPGLRFETISREGNMKFQNILAGTFAIMALAGPAFGQAATAPAAPIDKKIHFKGITLSLGGFLAAETVWRSANLESDIGSPGFAKIPFPGPGPGGNGNNVGIGHTGEFRLTARQSRVQGLVEGDFDPDTHFAMYGEFDFLGAAASANSNESNSFQPRIRNLYGTVDWSDIGVHFLFGQNWSFATLNGQGMAERTELAPATIEAQYSAGFVWTRQPQLRIVKNFGNEFWMGVSLENPQTTIGGTAFNILNVGRFKLGAMCVGGGRVSLENAIAYAKQRKAFNKVIADFGLVREKIANMATLLYVGESLVYRTVALMDGALSEVDKSAADAAKQTLKAIEEYAVECSIIKVWGSEMIDYVVDETVQIYGGYGFVEEYPAERAYRDARINRIFEGTNEINRLIITGFLLKRAMSGQLPLMPAIKKLMDEVLSGPSVSEDLEGPLADERKLVAQAKKLGLFAAGAATQKYMQAIQDQQEIMGAIADMTIETYAMESAVLRAQKIAQAKGESDAALPIAMTRVYLSQAIEKVESAARKVIAAVADGDMLRTQLAILRRLAKYEPFNTIELRQQIAQKTIERGKYTLA